MKISIITLFPEMFEGVLSHSIVGRAIRQQQVEVECIQLRDFAKDRYRHVDDTPYGGGQGQIIQCQPVIDAIRSIKTKQSYVIALTPIGQVYTQKVCHDLTKYSHLILLCGHYEGFDYRIYDYCDALYSIGDYVLTGGEIGAMVLVDSITRLLPDVIKMESHQDESFEDGLLEYPQYTKPKEFEGKQVPEVLLSGHHQNIQAYRKQASLELTKKQRPDLYVAYQQKKGDSNE